MRRRKWPAKVRWQPQAECEPQQGAACCQVCPGRGSTHPHKPDTRVPAALVTRQTGNGHVTLTDYDHQNEACPEVLGLSVRSEALAHVTTHMHLGSVTLRERSQCRGPLLMCDSPDTQGEKRQARRAWRQGGQNQDVGRGALDVMWVRRWMRAEVGWTEAA